MGRISPYRGDDDMLRSDVFDLWADGYEDEVDKADDNDEYPFAGYKKIQSMILSLPSLVSK